MTGIINGQLTSADEVMNAFGSNFNDTAQMIFNADYIGFNSRLNNSGSPSLKNVFYSTFTSDDADEVSLFEYDATNDLYKTTDLSSTVEYIIIEADDATLSWTDNDCLLSKLSSGKWIITCSVGTDAVQRAQIIKSLFYGTDSTDQLILDFTNVTSVKTSHSNDVGKQGHYATARHNTSTPQSFTGTFTNTTTNTNCSSWSRAFGAGESDELGTDTTGDEVDNPANGQLEVSGGGAGAFGRWEIPSATIRNSRSETITTMNCEAIILCVGDITWVDSGLQSSSDIDFFTTHSIPLMTAAGTLTAEGADVSFLIFKDTVSSTDNAIAVINSAIDVTSSQQISISADGGSNFTNVNNAEIARPVAGTALWRKIAITRTDLSKEDKVTEQAVKFNYY